MIRKFVTVVVVLLVFYVEAFGFLKKKINDHGRDIQPETTPKRIISLAPSLTEALYLLGIGERLKGCTIYCKKPEEAKQKEKIGTLVDVYLEKVLTLKPDLVLAMQFSDRKAVEKLKDLGIRVELFPSPKNFNHLCQLFLQLGQIVTCEEKAKEIVAKAKKDVAFIRHHVEGLKKIKIFWQLGARPLFAATRNLFTNDYIEFAGGENIAAGAKSGIYSREEVLKRNPDVIVIVTMGIAAEKEKHTWQTYTSINAVKNNRVFIVDSYKYCSPTPKGFVDALKELVSILHPSISYGEK